MITTETAAKILNRKLPRSKIINIKTEAALGMVLARSIKALLPSPPFTKSAMDGYAFNSRDRLKKFEIAGTLGAGTSNKNKLKKGQCLKIMTGAPLPPGADKVIRVEYTANDSKHMTIRRKEKGSNICYKGENHPKGKVLIRGGTILREQELAVLASEGYTHVDVYQKPRVCVITTGSEIVNAGSRLSPGKIYNSNGPAIAAALSTIGLQTKPLGPVPDEPSRLKTAIKKALFKNDVIILSGGVSMGDYDFIPAVLTELGVKLEFKKVAVKPGKPTLFGRYKDKFIFGLPGNPVSTFIIFKIFIKPFIYSLMGCRFSPRTIKGITAFRIERKKNTRTEYKPVILKNGKIYPVSYQGSGHLSALLEANGLITIPRGVDIIPKGKDLDVRPI